MFFDFFYIFFNFIFVVNWQISPQRANHVQGTSDFPSLIGRPLSIWAKMLQFLNSGCLMPKKKRRCQSIAVRQDQGPQVPITLLFLYIKQKNYRVENSIFLFLLFPCFFFFTVILKGETKVNKCKFSKYLVLY